MSFELILRHVAKHIRLTSDEQVFFTSLLQPRILKKKSFLLRSGEVCMTETFIVKGCLRMYSIDENGFEHIIMFGIEDWWVGDLYSLLTGMPSRFYIDALEDTEVLQISRLQLELLYEEVPKFERFFRLIIQNAFVAQQQRIHQNIALSAEQRYLEFINKYHVFEQRIPQKQIAAYLGITPVFLSMLRKRMAQHRHLLK